MGWMGSERNLRSEGLNKIPACMPSVCPSAPSCAGAEIEMEGETLLADIE